ncbi:MAG: cytochrome b/b6 domain-containing protein, partial [Candidatus Acidiferrales bacterium]
MSDAYIPPKGRVLRYTFHERFIHWMAGLSYVYLLLTGLAFWSPWLFWLAVIFGGGTIARELHPWIGLIFVIAVCLMFWMWSTQMHETAVDKQWWDAVGHYIR